jgi:hypothetical protein
MLPVDFHIQRIGKTADDHRSTITVHNGSRFRIPRDEDSSASFRARCTPVSLQQFRHPQGGGGRGKTTLKKTAQIPAAAYTAKRRTKLQPRNFYEPEGKTSRKNSSKLPGKRKKILKKIPLRSRSLSTA